MAAITRTSTGNAFVEPTGRTCISCSTRSSFTWSAGDSSAISSRKIVPSSAPRKRPSASATAPENAPRTWPKNSDSSKSWGIALQFTGMNGRLARDDSR